MNKSRQSISDKPTDGDAGDARGRPTDGGAADGGPETRLNILQVLPNMVAGGVERGTIDVAAAIVDAGGKAVVASAGGPLTRELDRVGATHVELPVASKNPVTMRANRGRLADVVEKHGIDLIHARSRAPAWSARAAARHTGRAFVTTFHGTYNFRGSLKRRYNAIMTKGDRVIAISNFIAEHILANYKIPAERIDVVPRGVDESVFDPAKVPAARMIQLNDEWRLPDGAAVVMLPARLSRWKGQTVFLEALKKLGRDDICAVLLGPHRGRSSYRAELEGLVKKHDLGNTVRFVDNCRDMPAALMLANVVVSASTDPEAFGRIIIEAQAIGRPVIATDHGGARETVIGGETGWLVPPGDVDALAGAIGAALDLSDRKRQAMSKAGIANVRAHFTKDEMCARTLKVYRKTMAAKSGVGRV